MAQTFDEAELMARVDHDRQFLAETVEMLTSDAPKLVEELRRALAGGDAPAVGRLAHSLKGMVSNFCAPQAQASALELERLGKGGDLSLAEPALSSLEQHVGALTSELRNFIGAAS